MCFESVTTNEFNAVFWGNQTCQYGTYLQSFTYCVYLHHQRPTGLKGREDCCVVK